MTIKTAAATIGKRLKSAALQNVAGCEFTYACAIKRAHTTLILNPVSAQ